MPLRAAELATLRATILDVAGGPVAGAKVFVYDSGDTRRPADFISPVSDREGRTVLHLPPGRYWAVARLKKDGTYGPLMPGDKHSGEPVILEPAAGEVVGGEFVVADIRDVGRTRVTVASESVVLRGRILDREGAPVANGYVFANRAKEGREIPEFLSAWSDGAGSYTLYLPAGGRFYVGVATRFPPDAAAGPLREISTEAGKADIALDLPIGYGN
ncbi:carboxypeptidase-like regulatory domain-containing protein [Geobacter sp.]|uniref:carboxypeptidase-like regulatory domain-containing protein n=1 Tax=Geobacter sp. TaxID=46610 RepID=UPI002629B4EF|nr:carboxypeptidase-like regulatory domain-containing protein [Geobacter sp.]